MCTITRVWLLIKLVAMGDGKAQQILNKAIFEKVYN